MKQGRSLVELAQEIARQVESKKDYIAPSGRLEMNAHTHTVFGEKLDAPEISMQVPVNGHSEPHGITPLAHGQIAEKLDIPAAYYKRMQSQQPALLASNVNTWLQSRPEQRHMVRTLDGRVRALLSDKYKRIDNYDVMQVALPEVLGKDGIQIASAELTESRLYLKVVTDRVAGEIRVGQAVRGGFIVSNSEVGQGAISVSPFVEELRCTNGMVVTEFSQRRNHVGKRAAEEDFSIYSDATIELDMQAFFGKVRDSIRAALEQAKFDIILGKLREAAGAGFSHKAAEAVVELAQQRFNLTADESKDVFRHLLISGEFDLMGLASAVTRTAQDSQSYDRATELEAVGYKVINIDPKDVRRLEAA